MGRCVLGTRMMYEMDCHLCKVLASGKVELAEIWMEIYLWNDRKLVIWTVSGRWMLIMWRNKRLGRVVMDRYRNFSNLSYRGECVRVRLQPHLGLSATEAPTCVVLYSHESENNTGRCDIGNKTTGNVKETCCSYPECRPTCSHKLLACT